MQTIDLLSSSKIKDATTSSISSEVKKEGFSLFDSLLSEASSEDSLENGDSKEQINNKSKENNKLNKTIEEKVETKSEIKIETKSKEVEVEDKNSLIKKEASSLSLLDRMLLDAKKSIFNEEIAREEITSNSLKSSSNEIISLKNEKSSHIKETNISKETSFIKDKNTYNSLSLEENSNLITKEKIQDYNTINNDEVKDKLGNINNNIKDEQLTKKTIENISNNIKDEQLTKKTIENISNNIKDEQLTKNTIENISNNIKDEQLTKNTIENINNNIKDEQLTKNTIENISNNIKDEQLTKNTIENINSNIKDEQKVENKTKNLLEDNKQTYKINLDTNIIKNIEINQENNKENLNKNDNAIILKNTELIIENKEIDTKKSLIIETSKNEVQRLSKELIDNEQQTTQKIILETNRLKEGDVLVVPKILNNEKQDTENNTFSNDAILNKEKIILDKDIEIKTTNNIVESKFQQEINVNLNEKKIKIQDKLILETKVVDEKIENDKLEVKTTENSKIQTNEILSTKNASISLESEIDAALASPKNEKVASELAKIDNTTASENKKVQLGAHEVENRDAPLENEKSTNKKTLIEKLVEDSSLNKEEIVKARVETKVDDKTILNSKNDLLTNIYLGSQKNSIVNQSIIAQYEGIKVVREANSLEDIKKSAKILELELTDTKIEIKDNVNKEFSKDTILEKLVRNRNTIQEFNNSNLQTQATSSLSQSQTKFVSQNTTINEMPDVSFTVPQTLAMSIQSKIIGARQQMSSMMSEMARTMYENYKPPITAFRINLLPAQLGTIAILMRNDRENGGLNISLNISNSSTLEAFVDNETGLKNALLKTFESESEFNLDFSSNENSQNNSSNNQKEQQHVNKKEKSSSNEVFNSLNNHNKNDISNYM